MALILFTLTETHEAINKLKSFTTRTVVSARHLGDVVTIVCAHTVPHRTIVDLCKIVHYVCQELLIIMHSSCSDFNNCNAILNSTLKYVALLSDRTVLVNFMIIA